MERLMRSSPENFCKLFLGDPDDPKYAQRLNAYNLERMAQAYRAMVTGEMVADGILWVARPLKPARAGRQ
jgi:hypothetical protein